MRKILVASAVLVLGFGSLVFTSCASTKVLGTKTCASSKMRLYLFLPFKSNFEVYCGARTTPVAQIFGGALSNDLDGLGYDNAGDIFVATRTYTAGSVTWATIREYDRNGRKLPGEVDGLENIGPAAVNHEDNRLYVVTNHDSHDAPPGKSWSAALDVIATSPLRIVKRYPLPLRRGDALPTSLQIDKSGRLYIDNEMIPIYVLDPETGKILHAFDVREKAGYIAGWVIGQNDYLYILDKEHGASKIFEYDLATFRRVQVFSIPNTFSMANLYNDDITVARDGTMYIRDGDTFRAYHPGISRPITLGSFVVDRSSLAFDEHDNLYVLSVGYGAMQSSPRFGQLKIPLIYAFKAGSNRLIRTYSITIPRSSQGTRIANGMILIPAGTLK